MDFHAHDDGFGAVLPLVPLIFLLINGLFIVRIIAGVRRKAISPVAGWIHFALIVSWCCLFVLTPTFLAFAICCIASLHLFIGAVAAEWKMVLQKSSPNTNV